MIAASGRWLWSSHLVVAYERCLWSWSLPLVVPFWSLSLVVLLIGAFNRCLRLVLRPRCAGVEAERGRQAADQLS